MLRKIRKMLKHQEGFTLVELMIVVVILGILAGVGIQQYGAVQENARRSVNQANIRMIANAVRMYQVMTGLDPTDSEPDTDAVWEKLKPHGLDARPNSPWTNDGVYEVKATDTGITIGHSTHPADNITIDKVITTP